jgi:hypothetical protein
MGDFAFPELIHQLVNFDWLADSNSIGAKYSTIAK